MQVLTHDLLPTLGVPVVVETEIDETEIDETEIDETEIDETEIDETTNEVVSTYKCGCVRTRRLVWYRVGGRGSRDISAYPSVSRDETERCEKHEWRSE